MSRCIPPQARPTVGAFLRIVALPSVLIFRWKRSGERFARFHNFHGSRKTLTACRLRERRGNIHGKTPLGDRRDLGLLLANRRYPRAHHGAIGDEIHSTTREHVTLVAMFLNRIGPDHRKTVRAASQPRLFRLTPGTPLEARYRQLPVHHQQCPAGS